MILNENLIQNVVLKRTLVQQISRIHNLISKKHLVQQKIQRLSQQIHIQQNTLKNTKYSHLLTQQHLDRQKQAIQNEIQTKLYFKMTQKQSLQKQMKELSHNCYFIRQKKEKLLQLKSKQNRLNNQIEQLQVIEKQQGKQIEKIETERLFDRKTQNQQTQKMRQYFKLIQAKKDEIKLENQLRNHIKTDINQTEQQIQQLRQEINNKTLSNTKLSSQIQKQQSQVQKIMQKHTKMKKNVETLAHELNKLQHQTMVNASTISQSQSKQQSLNIQLSRMINESNQLHGKIVTIKNALGQLKQQKTVQKQANQNLKNKIRQLMKMVVEQHSQQKI